VKKFAAENSAEPQWFIVHSTEPIKFGFGLQKRQKKVLTVMKMGPYGPYVELVDHSIVVPSADEDDDSSVEEEQDENDGKKKKKKTKAKKTTKAEKPRRVEFDLAKDQ
jgi:hypothetical protein